MSITDTTMLRTAIGMLAAVCFLAGPAVSANPYSAISDRNIFRLKDPPPDAPPVVEEEPEPLPNVMVTGITTVMGVDRALIKVVTPANPKTKTPAKEASYILVAGGPPMDGVEVLDIVDDPDPKEVKVKVRQGGKESWLSLEKDKVAVAAVAAAKPVPAANLGKAIPAQAAAQRLAAARAAAVQAQTGGAPQPGIPGALPNRNIRTAQGGPPGTTPGMLGVNSARDVNRTRVARDYGLSPEEQVILIEANREVSVVDVAVGDMPPLPPTEMTPPELDPTSPPPSDPLDEFFPGGQ